MLAVPGPFPNEYVLFDFNKKNKKSWNVSNLGGPELCNATIKLEAYFYSEKIEDTIYVFNDRSSLEHFIFEGEEPSDMETRILVSKKYGILLEEQILENVDKKYFFLAYGKRSYLKIWKQYVFEPNKCKPMHHHHFKKKRSLRSTPSSSRSRLDVEWEFH